LRFRVQEEALLAQAKAHLVRILELMGVQARVESLHRKRGLTLNIIAEDDGSLIIGKMGQNLDSLQYLINRMTTRSTRELAPILVDSEDYREKRLAKLEELARNTARRVVRTGREAALEPMSASERKAIHMIVKEVRGIHSISRGENESRHIVITPAEGEGPPPNVFRGRPSPREIREGTTGGGANRGERGERRGGDSGRRGGPPSGDRERGGGGRGRGGPRRGGQPNNPARQGQAGGGQPARPATPDSTPPVNPAPDREPTND
jgi:spoIIIJ-associated protein